LIFVDSNIPMYLIGAAHPTDGVASHPGTPHRSRERLVTDAEVLQEILHRYTAIDRREAIGPAIQVTLDIVDEVIPIGKAEVLRAGEIVQNRVSMSARDALHIRSHGATRYPIDLQLRWRFRPLAGSAADSSI